MVFFIKNLRNNTRGILKSLPPKAFSDVVVFILVSFSQNFQNPIKSYQKQTSLNVYTTPVRRVVSLPHILHGFLQLHI